LSAAAILAILIALDVAKPLGAHPWWSQNRLLIGAPIGLILATLLAPVSTPLIRFGVGVALTALALGVEVYGKTQFAAAFAEDTFAGSFGMSVALLSACSWR